MRWHRVSVAALAGSFVGAVVASASCSGGPIPLGRLAAEDAGDDAASFDAGADVDGASCAPPAPSRHYAFDGTGTEVVDRASGPSAQLLGGAVLDGSGVVLLDGVDDYVALPSGLFAGRSSISVAVWLRRFGGPAYTRIFDIGTGSAGEAPSPDAGPTVGTTYLAATPATGFVPSGLAALLSQGGSAGEVVAPSPIVLDEDAHHLVVVAVSASTLSLYHDGDLVARVPHGIPLGAIVDHNAWLGRSQYSQDPYLRAEYADVRVYGEALEECHVRALFLDGPSLP